MCLSNEVIDELHAITSAIKEEQSKRDEWIETSGYNEFDDPPTLFAPLNVTRAEAERIFADRIGTLEARLKELGWSRTVRVTEIKDQPC